MNIKCTHKFIENSDFKKRALEILHYTYFNSCVDNLLSVHHMSLLANLHLICRGLSFNQLHAG